MHHVVVKDGRSRRCYLGFDDHGNHEWKENFLDATRLTSDEAYQCCGHYLRTGARLAPVGKWHGYYEAYRGFEVQVFHDNIRDIPGGKRWRYRIGPINTVRAYEYAPGRLGFTSPQQALAAAKVAVNRKQRCVVA